MFTKTLKIICAICRYIIITFTFTFWCFTIWFFTLWIKILMLFKTMITKTFSLWSNHFTLYTISISPTKIKSIFTFLRYWQYTTHYIKLFILLNLFVRNHQAVVLNYNYIEFYIFIDCFIIFL
jgi:hypothetical protein